MTHTSQRRGLDRDDPSRELIVLAMVPGWARDKAGVGEAMSELAEKMLEHEPANWLIKNFTETDIPDLGPAQPILEWWHKRNPEGSERFLMKAAGRLSSVVTALYTDREKVVALIDDIKGPWLERNRKKHIPISVVLSGRFDDVGECCDETGKKEHTYLHSLGFFGKAEELPGELELELMTMCGHGLIAHNRIKYLIREIKRERKTPGQAALDLCRPCVCGIVNPKRAERIFIRLVEAE